MTRGVRVYVVLLLVLVAGWVALRAQGIALLGQSLRLSDLLGVCALYMASHVLRMLRLGLLTLDEREKVFPLAAAHALTAFPSSFLPFKLGEALRLAAFFHVYGRRRKALAVWLAERFGDVLVIAGFILVLYVVEVEIPDSMRAVFVLFVVLSLLGVFGLFAVAKVFVYLNRHLVLKSHSRRGLALLRVSHALRRLEADIHESVRGRVSALILLSILIWSFEIAALSQFIRELSMTEPDFAAWFVSGLIASLPGGSGGGAELFGLYQSLALVTITLVAAAVLCLHRPGRSVKLQ